LTPISWLPVELVDPLFHRPVNMKRTSAARIGNCVEPERMFCKRIALYRGVGYRAADDESRRQRTVVFVGSKLLSAWVILSLRPD
jgi:hypothetical protein